MEMIRFRFWIWIWIWIWIFLISIFSLFFHFISFHFIYFLINLQGLNNPYSTLCNVQLKIKLMGFITIFFQIYLATAGSKLYRAWPLAHWGSKVVQWRLLSPLQSMFLTLELPLPASSVRIWWFFCWKGRQNLF